MTTTSQIPRVSRDGIAVVVNVFRVVGVKCPHYHCRQIIEESKIKQYVDATTYDKFDQFALDQTLVEMLQQGQLHPCPLGCGYFAQEDCLCVNPECRKRQLRIRSRDVEGYEKLRTWAESNTKLVRLCPHCYVRIEKNGGCDYSTTIVFPPSTSPNTS